MTEENIKDNCPYDGTPFHYTGFFSFNLIEYFGKISVTCKGGHRFNASKAEVALAGLLPKELQTIDSAFMRPAI